MSAKRLFEPLKLGNLQLSHRMILAPLTRFRADDKHVPGPWAKTYYEQRASTPGTFLVTEATFISPRAGGFDKVPGIWNDAQIDAWKEIVDAVHAKGCFIYCQLWALGRAAVPGNVEKGGYEYVSSSAVPMSENHPAPKAMTEDDIQVYINDYAAAARNAIRAGFDGVEIHAANGYLIDQFWQDVVNKRTDKYGGSVENRTRFGLEVTKAIIEAVGDSRKVGIRLSPWATGQGMRMEDPIPQFSHTVTELRKLHLAYLHLVESRVQHGSTVLNGEYHAVTRENDKFVELWGTEAPIILAGGFTSEKAQKVMGEIYTAENVCIAFGRLYISTPDLPFRIKSGLELNKYNRDTFYKPYGPEGYTDYPFSKEWEAQQVR